MLVIFTVIIIPTNAADVALGCDEGWYYNNGYCYLFYNTRMVTWQQASDECDRYDSSLLYFDDLNEEVSPEEEEEIRSVFDDIL